MSRILVVDDDSSILGSFDKLLTAAGYEVLVANRGELALDLVQQKRPALVLLDIRMPGMDGIEVLQRIKRIDPRLPVIILTAFSTTDVAIEAIKHGAFDYQVKPFDPGALLQTIEGVLGSLRLMQREVTVNPESRKPHTDAIIGQSPGMLAVYKAIGKVAATDATVLIRGETGTGKELVARAVYQHSHRANRPLLIVNCTAIPETLLESELFGYEKGAYTGAISRRLGKFELANGGTLFLDEIGDVPLSIQAKLLRVLQEQTFERLGGERTISVDVRVLAATNRDLVREIQAGRFRDDLYHRLNVFTVQLPPLRERREDIPAMIEYFLEVWSRRLGVDKPMLTDAAFEQLRDHDWPGNVRELENCIQRAMINAGGYPIQPDDVLSALGDEPVEASRGELEADPDSLRELVRRHLRTESRPARHQILLNDVERLLVAEALRSVGGNQTKAARLLGLSRPTLQAKMQKHRIRRETGILED